MTRRRNRLALRTASILLVCALTGFAYRQFHHAKTLPDLPTASARRGDFLVLVHSRGELGAKRSVQLTAPLDVADLQIVWLAPAGGPVKAGEVVIKFDPSRSQQELKEKSAALTQAQATFDQAVAQARITSEQDKLDLQSADFQAEKAKLEASKQAIVSAIQGEESGIDLGLAQEKVKVQQSTAVLHKKSDEAKIASLARLRDEAKAQVDLTQRRLAMMELHTPLDGVITYLPNYSQGWMNAEPFRVGDHAVPGGALAEVPDLATLQMESRVEEVDRGRINVGDAVLVHVDAFPEKVLQAKLASITPLTEQSFEEWPPTRSFKAYAAIDAPDARMRPGMNAAADVVERKIPDAITVPAKALFTLRGKPAVYVKTQGQFLATEVKVLARNPDEIAIEGIAAGSLVALTEPPNVQP